MGVLKILFVSSLLLTIIDFTWSFSIHRSKRSNFNTSNSDLSRAIRDNEKDIQAIKNLINQLKAQTGDLKTILCKNILRKIDDEDDCSAANPFTIDTEGRIRDLQAKARDLENKLEEFYDSIQETGRDFVDLKTRTSEALEEVKSSGVRLSVASEDNLDELAYLNEFYEDYLDVYKSLYEEYHIMKSS